MMSNEINLEELEALQGLLLFPNNPRENRKARAAIAAAESQQDEPVNARLLTAAKAAVAFIEGKPDAVEPFGLLREAISAADAQQGRLLQDMHDAGREIDRVMAEPEQKAVRLTDEEVDICFDGSDGTRIGAARAIETAVLRKNGLALED